MKTQRLFNHQLFAKVSKRSLKYSLHKKKTRHDECLTSKQKQTKILWKLLKQQKYEKKVPKGLRGHRATNLSTVEWSRWHISNRCYAVICCCHGNNSICGIGFHFLRVSMVTRVGAWGRITKIKEAETAQAWRDSGYYGDMLT